jgi:hypothetical protein
MFKWLTNKNEFLDEKTLDEMREHEKEEYLKGLITLECEGSFIIRLRDLVTQDALYNPTYTVIMDYNVDIYYEGNLESIKSKGTIQMTTTKSEKDAYAFIIKQYKDGAKSYMKFLQRDVIYDYKNHLENNDISTLKQMVKQQKPIQVKFTVKA